jgi:hypothetical protein
MAILIYWENILKFSDFFVTFQNSEFWGVTLSEKESRKY